MRAKELSVDHRRKDLGKGTTKCPISLSVILPGKLTENTFSFAATTWGIVTGTNEPIVNWGLLGDRDGLRARLGI